ncbi:MAG: hypothetical protein KGL39_33770 [Patescibacteria group bacterium]|nr:hypothetical protein [Patescibacteria group bacterium]
MRPPTNNHVRCKRRDCAGYTVNRGGVCTSCLNGHPQPFAVRASAEQVLRNGGYRGVDVPRCRKLGTGVSA